MSHPLARIASDHRVLGEPILPGMAGLELVLGTLSAERPGQSHRLLDVEFLRPVRVRDFVNSELRVELNDDGTFRVVAAAGEPGHDPTVYVRGNWSVNDTDRPQPQSLPDISKRCTESLPVTEVYDWYRRLGLDYGPSLQVVQNVDRNGQEAIGRLAADSERGFLLHPALGDGALQLLGTLAFDRDAKDNPLYLPTAIQEVRCYQTLPERIWCHGRTSMTRTGQPDRLVGHLSLMDDAGAIMAELVGVTASRLGARTVEVQPTPPKPPHPSIWRRKWSTAEMSKATVPICRDWLVWADRSDPQLETLVRGLRRRGLRITLADPSGDDFEFPPSVGGMLWLAGCHDSSSPGDQESRIGDQIERFARGLRRLADSPISSAHVLLVTRDAQDVVPGRLVHPGAAGLIGLLNAVQLERPSWSCRAVDIDSADTATDDRIWRELHSDWASEPPEVTWHGAERWVAEWERGDGRDRTEPNWLVRGGTYVITGGLGGIGQCVARWLAADWDGQVVLVSRRERPLPDALRPFQSQITFAQGDLGDGEEVQRVVAGVGASFGRIHAVFHCAGQNQDSLLVNKSWAAFREVLRPKIDGTLHLANALADSPQTAIVLFSSISGVAGNIGQSDYAAANRFLNAWAAQHANSRPIKSLAWGPWSEVGMARDLADAAAQFGLRPFSPQDGIAALQDAVLGVDAVQLVVDVKPGTMAQLLRIDFGSAASTEPPSADVEPDADAMKPSVDELIALLRVEFARSLEVDVESVDVDIDVQELGVDSIIAFQMFAEFDVPLTESFSPFTLFEYATIRELATFLHGTLPPESLFAIMSSRGVDLEPTRPDDHDVVVTTQQVDKAASSASSSPTTAPIPDLPPKTPHSPPLSTPGSLSLPSTSIDLYGQFARPELAARLQSVRLDQQFDHGIGAWLEYDEGGQRRRVLDLVGGFGSTLLGHNPPELCDFLVSVIRDARPFHAQASVRGGAALFAERLAEWMRDETGREFIITAASTGAEAVEAALRHAEFDYDHRLKRMQRTIEREEALGASQRPIESSAGESPTRAEWEADCQRLAKQRQSVWTSKPVVIALRRSFHGRTAAAARVTSSFDQAIDHSWGRAETDVVWIDADGTALRKEFQQRTHTVTSRRIDRQGTLQSEQRTWCSVLAVIVEPVQGEGGIWVLPTTFAEELRTIADTHDVPVIVDEIQSGLGRCGRLTAARQIGLIGDYYTFAKSLGGGLAKVAALCVDRRRYSPAFGRQHTSTFGEDDHSSLVAWKTLEMIRRDALPDRCISIGEALGARLDDLRRRFPRVVSDVRGMGCFWGLELWEQRESQSAAFQAAGDQLGWLVAGFLFHECGLRVLPTTSNPLVLRLEPPAILSTSEIDQIIAGFERMCEAIEKANAGFLLRYIADDQDVGSEIADWRGRHPTTTADETDVDASAAFLMYFIESEDMLRWDPSLSEIAPALRRDFISRLSRVAVPRSLRRLKIRSQTNKTVALDLFGFLLTSSVLEERMQDSDEVENLLASMDGAIVDAAESCRVVGLGGGLSIIAGNATTLATSRVPLTTGNALTVGAGYRACLQACESSNIDLSAATAAVLGAGGNIGSTYTLLIARHVPRVILVGRDASQTSLVRAARAVCRQLVEFDRRGESCLLLDAARAAVEPSSQWPEDDAIGDASAALWNALRENPESPVRVTGSLSDLREASVILSGTNSAHPVIFPDHIGPRPVVICDLAVPADVDESVIAERPQACVLTGGVVRLPHDQRPDLRVGSLPDGCLFACAAETLLLALEDYPHEFSFGAVQVEQVDWILGVAEKHGFLPTYVRRTTTTPDEPNQE